MFWGLHNVFERADGVKCNPLGVMLVCACHNKCVSTTLVYNSSRIVDMHDCVHVNCDIVDCAVHCTADIDE